MDTSIRTAQDWLVVQKIPTINMGSDVTLLFQALDRLNQAIVNITSATEIAVVFPNADSSTLQKKLSMAQVTIVDAIAGKFSVDLLAAETVKFPPDLSTISVYLTIAGKLTIMDVVDAYMVEVPSLPLT